MMEVAASIRNDPWVMTTPSDNTDGCRSSNELLPPPALIPIGCERSDDYDHTAEDRSSRIPTASSILDMGMVLLFMRRSVFAFSRICPCWFEQSMLPD